MVYAYEIDIFKEESHTLAFWVYVQTVILGLCTLFWPDGFLQITTPAGVIIGILALVIPLWFTIMYTTRTTMRFARMWWKDHPLTDYRAAIRFWMGISGFGSLISVISVVYLAPLLPQELPHHAISVVFKVLHLG